MLSTCLLILRASLRQPPQAVTTHHVHWPPTHGREVANPASAPSHVCSGIVSPCPVPVAPGRGDFEEVLPVTGHLSESTVSTVLSFILKLSERRNRRLLGLQDLVPLLGPLSRVLSFKVEQ